MGNKQSILLVDNEVNVLQVTKEMLESLNYRVTGKSNSVEALNLFTSTPEQYHLVMCDYATTHMDGIRFAKAVRKISQNIPIIISNGFSFNARLDATKMEGLARLINKPIIRSDLAQLMAECLQTEAI
jgi:CheY-like chemotaxis protein